MNKKTEFVYQNIKLYKSQGLGRGSYGGVCKAECDGLLCAAKIMHPALFNQKNAGSSSYIRKFEEECHLLSLARHPNVVQYLGTYYDPDTQQPVLLMELCNESLTAFLERSPGPLSYNIQVNICHDIALALVYLHYNDLIHRDLTGNNILMVAGPRAKITDFGMSKLASVCSQMKTLTHCPGNLSYMSPEALDEARLYTAKLDIFSFGVITIQILTRLFPEPSERFRKIHDREYNKEMREVVTETKRRQAHLSLIPDTHPLKPLVIECLKQNESERPPALHLSKQLSELKKFLPQTQLLSPPQDLAIMNEAEKGNTEAKQVVISELQRIIQTKERHLQLKEGQTQEQWYTILLLHKMLQEKGIGPEARLREVEEQHGIKAELEEKLRVSEQVVCEFQLSLQDKDKNISDLHETISAQEIKIRQLEEQATQQQTQYQPVTAPQRTTAHQKDISNKKWRKGKNAPEAMYGVAAVAHGNTAYFRPTGSQKVYSLQLLGKERWSQLPDNTNLNCGLAIIDGYLTSVGGKNGGGHIDTLLSLRGERENKRWSEIFPPMPTPRCNAACITTALALVVAGGEGASDSVEVMNIGTKLWTKVASLPQKCLSLSATVCGDTLYCAAGFTDRSISSKSVFACYLPDLLPPTVYGSGSWQPNPNVWNEISSLPVTQSVLVAVGGHVLAVGGMDDSGNPNSVVCRYDPINNSWTVASQMINKRSLCLAVSLTEDHLIVVGGLMTSKLDSKTSSIEVFE